MTPEREKVYVLLDAGLLKGSMKKAKSGKAKGIKAVGFSMPKECAYGGRRNFSVVARKPQNDYEVSAKKVVSVLDSLAAGDVDSASYLPKGGSVREIDGETRQDVIFDVACIRGAMAIVQKWAKGGAL